MSDEIEDFFLNIKSVKILVKLLGSKNPNYAASISQDVDSTYSHTVKTLQKLEGFGLAESHKKGRKRELELTNQGKEVAELFRKLLQEIENIDSS